MTNPDAPEEPEAPPTSPPDGGTEDQADDANQTIEEAWRSCDSGAAKTGFVLSVITLVLSVIDAAMAIYFMVWLISPGFKGGMAGFALVYAPLLWALVLFPLGMLTLILVAAAGSSEDARVLKSRASLFVLFGLGGSLIIVFAAIFITIAMA